jgi:branched-chain amino acid transport system permease protein
VDGFRWDLVPQLLVTGLLSGIPYALAAWGLAVVLGSGVLNLTQGTFFAVGAYLAYAVTGRGLPAVWAVAPAVAAGLLFGGGIDRVFVRPLRAQPLSATAVLLGLAIGGEAALRLAWGPAARSVPLRLPVLQIQHVVVTGTEQFIAAGVALALYGLLAAARRSRAGLALRAAADNPEIAVCTGLDVERLRAWTFAAACAAAAAAGALLAPITPLSPEMGRGALLVCLAVVAAGGPGLGGLLLAALAVVTVTQSAATYLAPQWGTVIPALVLAGAAARRWSPLWRRVEA